MGGSNPISDAVKSVTKAVSDVGKTVSKAANDTFKTVTKAAEDTVKTTWKATEDAVNTTWKAVDDTGKELGRGWENNKDGINATTGAALRTAAAIYTGGASEALGAGEYMTTQFGGASDTANLGRLAGTIAGTYASGGTTALLDYGKNALSGGKMMPTMGAVTVPDNYVLETSRGNNDMSFFEDLGGLALDYGKQQLGLTNGSAKDRNIPQAPLPQPQPQPTAAASQSSPAIITVPASQPQSPMPKGLIYAGVGLGGLLLVGLFMSKK